MGKVILGIVGVIAVIAFIGNLGGSSSPSSTSTPAPSTSVAIGENGYLRNSANPIMVPISKSIFDETMKLSVAGDTAGLARMVVAGEILMVDNGTQVKVIDKNFASTEVRIMSGKNYGESGWVPMEFVSKN